MFSAVGSLHSSSTLLLTRAPDGSCILTNSADNVLRVYNLPPEIYSYNWDMLPEMVSRDIFTLFAHNTTQINSRAPKCTVFKYGDPEVARRHETSAF